MQYNVKTNIIETERLILRRFSEADAENIVVNCNDSNIYKFVTNLPHPFKLEHAIQWISKHSDEFANDKKYTYAIINKNHNKFVGQIGLNNDLMNKKSELGYWLSESLWEMGMQLKQQKP